MHSQGPVNYSSRHFVKTNLALAISLAFSPSVFAAETSSLVDSNLDSATNGATYSGVDGFGGTVNVNQGKTLPNWSRLGIANGEACLS